MSSKKSPPFMLTPRDYKILADIALCGGLTAEQIGVQHFNPAVIRIYQKDDNKNILGLEKLEIVIHANCQRRLKLFKDHGFTRRIELYQRLKEGKKPYLYTLTRLGAQAVASYKGCSLEETGWREREVRLRPKYVHHHLAINDIRLAIMRSLEDRTDITLERWYDEVELSEIHSTFTVPLRIGKTVKQVKLFPDACFVLSGTDGKPRFHFIECDMGTESVSGRNDLYRTFAAKMLAYQGFMFPQEGSQEVPPLKSVYKANAARVLTVTTSKARRKRLLEASEQGGAQNAFWFTTHEQITTPHLVPYMRKTKKDGVEIEVEAFEAVMPNVLSEPLWLIARDKDDTRPEHGLDEPFRRLSG